MLWRHENFEAEANVTSAVRDFLIATGLAASEEIVEENPPSEGSRRAVDLTALDTFIEVKRRISTAANGYPNADYVKQLDDYLAQSAKENRVRMGVLTDGKHWLAALAGRGAADDDAAPLLHAAGRGRLGFAVGVAAGRGAVFAAERPARRKRTSSGTSALTARPSSATSRRSARCTRATPSPRRSGSSAACGATCCARRWARWRVRDATNLSTTCSSATPTCAPC